MESVQMLVLALALSAGVCQHGGYSFSSFTGPVSGVVKAVPVTPRVHPAPHNPHQHYHPHAAATHHHDAAVDYVAKPDYTFAYGVDDPLTGNSQKHHESRDGDVVQGEYTVLEADGSVRTVTYTADPKHGFQATVHQSAPSHSSRPPQPQPQQQQQQHSQHTYHDY